MRTTIGTDAAPPVADLRGVVHQLVEAGGDEVVELHLADRPLAGERRADADAEHRALGERRVDDPIAELCEQRPQQQERVAVRAADVLAEDEDARIGAQRVAHARASRLRETCCPARSNGGPARPPAAPDPESTALPPRRIEHLDAHARRLVRERRPRPRAIGSGHGASMTARASRSTSVADLRLPARRASPAPITPSASSRAA